MNLAPIVLFVYNRPEHTLKTLRALENNRLAGDSELIVYADAAPNDATDEMKRRVEEVRAIVNQVWRFKSKELIEREWNWGLADNIIDGVTMVLQRFEKVIVMEDDLESSVGFIKYMNDALDSYQEHPNVFGVSGFNFPIGYDGESSTALIPYISTWGWGTWSSKWKLFDPNMIQSAMILSNVRLSERFNLADYDYTSMLLLNPSKSWGIRWYYTLFVNNGLFLFPKKSLIRNIGKDGSGTNYLNSSEEVFSDLASDVRVEYTQAINLDFLASYLEYFTKKTAKKRVRKNLFKRLASTIKSYLISDNSHLDTLLLGSNTRTQEMKVSVKGNLATKKIQIGDNSVVEAKLILENDNGRILIGSNSFIGTSAIVCINKIRIGNDVLISWGCTIIDNDAHSLLAEDRANDVKDWKKGLDEGAIGRYKDWSKVKSAPIVIQDKAWIGFNSIILKGVTIGEGAVVGAGSVVTKDVPPYTVVAGNPARVVKKLERNDLGTDNS